MSKINQTVDSQALNFGIQSVTSAKCPQEAGAASATAVGPPPTLTTVSGRTAVTNDLAGCVVLGTNTSATWAAANVVYATILSNTSGTNTVLTLDGWWKIADNTSGTMPVATSQYVVLPAQMPFWVMGLTDSTSSVAGTETGTVPGGTEIITNGLNRVIATTLTHTASASTGTIGKTFTYTGGTNQVIGRSFMSNSQTAAAGSGRGNFAFFVDQLNGTFGYNVASNGDTLQITYTITFATVP